MGKLLTRKRASVVRLLTLTVNMQHLQNDLLWEIAGFISVRGRSRMQNTCRRFKDVFSSPRAYVYNTGQYGELEHVPRKIWYEWVFSKTLEVPNFSKNVSILTRFRRLEVLYGVRKRAKFSCHTLVNCHELQELWFHAGTKVTNIHCLSKLQRLTRLHLFHVQLSDLSFISCLPNLEYFNISSNYDITDISPVGHLNNLKYFCASYIRNIHDISCLSQCTNLEHLNLQVTHVSNLTPLTNLINLKYLKLNRCPVTNVTPLSTLNSLIEISLTDCPITDLTPLISLTNVKITI